MQNKCEQNLRAECLKESGWSCASVQHQDGDAAWCSFQVKRSKTNSFLVVLFQGNSSGISLWFLRLVTLCPCQAQLLDRPPQRWCDCL